MAFCLSFGFYMHNPVLCYPYGVICVKISGKIINLTNRNSVTSLSTSPVSNYISWQTQMLHISKFIFNTITVKWLFTFVENFPPLLKIDMNKKGCLDPKFLWTAAICILFRIISFSLICFKRMPALAVKMWPYQEFSLKFHSCGV